MTIGKLSGQCDFGQKGQSYCSQRGQSCVAKRVKVAWLFHWATISKNLELLRGEKRLMIFILKPESFVRKYMKVGRREKRGKS